MRTVASFALLLLVLVASLDFTSWSKELEEQHTEEQAQRKSHRIRVFSSGWHFPPAQQGITNQFEGALVDDRWMRGGASSGLRVIIIPPGDGEIVLHRLDALGGSFGVNMLESLVNNAELNTTLILSSKQNLGKPSSKELREDRAGVQERRKKAGFLLRGMGVRSNPENENHVSFVFGCVRRPSGFVSLFEKFSTTRGVSASFHLAADLSVYDTHSARTIVDQRSLLAFGPEWAHGEGLSIQPGKLYLKEMGFSSLRFPVIPDEVNRVSWDIPKLLENSISPGTKDTPIDLRKIDSNGTIQFSSKIAWRYSPEDGVAALQFVLRVNGKRMGDRLILNDAAEKERWILWEEELSPDLGELKSLEIEVQTIGDAVHSETIHIADVQLNAGPLFSF